MDLPLNADGTIDESKLDPKLLEHFAGKTTGLERKKNELLADLAALNNTIKDLGGVDSLKALKEAANDRGVMTEAAEALTQIAGQKAIITRARKSNASFKIRDGMAIGCKVTLRREKMYEFLDRLVTTTFSSFGILCGLS